MGIHGDLAPVILNGKPASLRGVSPQCTLLDLIRSRGLTGAKEGCAEGECGACAVLLLKEVAGKTALLPVNSCLVLASMVSGVEVLTVESLAPNHQLAEVQRAMVESGGSQCGYCTPGFVVSMFAEHARAGSRCDLHALSGNLCRCTGYRPIRDALSRLGSFDHNEVKSRLNGPVAALPAIEHVGDDARFSRPTTLGACFELLRKHPEARLVAGNTDLGVVANLRNRKASHLISTEAIAELRVFHEDETEVQIGAALTLGDIEAIWTGAPPVLQTWMPQFASPLIRNRATLGGNLATASPIGDAAPLLLALGARVRLMSRDQGGRILRLEDFFLSYRETAMRSGELIVAVHIPKPFPSVTSFYKVAKRALDDISTVAGGIALSFGPTGRFQDVCIALGGVAAVPLRVSPAEKALENSLGGDADWAMAKRALAQALRPISDHRGSAEYRHAMAQSMLDRFRYEALEEAAA